MKGLVTVLSVGAPGKYRCLCVCGRSAAQSCWAWPESLFVTLGCRLPGSSGRRIFQIRILEWVAIFYSRGSSWPRDWTHISCAYCFGRQILYHCVTWEVMDAFKQLKSMIKYTRKVVKGNHKPLRSSFTGGGMSHPLLKSTFSSSYFEVVSVCFVVLSPFICYFKNKAVYIHIKKKKKKKSMIKKKNPSTISTETYLDFTFSSGMGQSWG